MTSPHLADNFCETYPARGIPRVGHPFLQGALDRLSVSQPGALGAEGRRDPDSSVRDREVDPRVRVAREELLRREIAMVDSRVQRDVARDLAYCLMKGLSSRGIIPKKRIREMLRQLSAGILAVKPLAL